MILCAGFEKIEGPKSVRPEYLFPGMVEGMRNACQMDDRVILLHRFSYCGQIKDVDPKMTEVGTMRRLDIEDIDVVRQSQFINNISASQPTPARDKYFQAIALFSFQNYLHDSFIDPHSALPNHL